MINQATLELDEYLSDPMWRVYPIGMARSMPHHLMELALVRHIRRCGRSWRKIRAVIR